MIVWFGVVFKTESILGQHRHVLEKPPTRRNLNANCFQMNHTNSVQEDDNPRGKTTQSSKDCRRYIHLSHRRKLKNYPKPKAIYFVENAVKEKKCSSILLCEQIHVEKSFFEIFSSVFAIFARRRLWNLRQNTA